ncbi:MAG TPA: LysR substrate-binding domain-containing protein [Burkholderiaceae bacterium]|nr:LysR substrate-binding domain-containing protein [Burkholderiaceae bacterium]
MKLHFDLVDLRLMINVAEANSITGGADRSCISLPAASSRIKHLEEMVGAKLLYRESQGVTLTPPGQALVQHARLVFNQLEQLRGELQEYAQGVKGHLRVAASTTAMTEFLPDVLRRYLGTHPDVNIDLREKLSPDIVRSVSDGTVDLGIISGEVRTEDLEVQPYRKDRLVVAMPPAHPLAAHDAVAFSATLAYDYVGLHEASAIHAFLNQKAREAHRVIRLRIQVGNFEAACRMIEANVGLGVLPESAAQRYANSMAIRVVPLTDEWSLRHLHVCMRSRALLPAFAAELLDLLIEDGKRP